MAAERLDIVIAQKGGKTAKKAITDIGTESKKAERSVSLLSKGLGLIGVGLAARKVVQLADSYTTMQNRIKTVTKDQKGLNSATNELFKIANRTRNAVKGTVEFYARLSNAAKALGKDQSELLAITETVNQAVALSGATSSEASGALRQLSQGLGSGTLRGEELNSVLEQLPIIADLIADSLGVARGELRALAQDGQLTADVVVAALEGGADKIRQAFEQSTPTIAQSFQVLENSATQFVGQLDQASGASRFVSETILLVANNLDVLSGILLSAAIPALISFTKTWLVFAASNPALLLAGLSAAVVVFGSNLKVSEEKGTTFFDVFRQGFRQIGEAAEQMTKDSDSAFGTLFDDGNAAAGDFDNIWRVSILTVADYFDVFRGAAAGVFGFVAQLAKSTATLMLQAFQLATNGIIKSLNAVIDGIEFVANAGNKELAKLTGIETPQIEFGQIPNLPGNAPRSFRELVNPFTDAVDEFRRLYDQFRNDPLGVKNFAEDALKGADKARAKQKALEEDRLKASNAAAAAVVENERKIAAAANGTIAKLQEQVRLFGLTADQRQIQQLRDSGAGPEDVAQAESLQRQLSILREFQSIVAAGSSLFNSIAEFRQSSTAVLEATSNAAAEVQAQAQANLAAGAQQIGEASRALFQQVATFLRTASEVALTDTQAIFTTGATTIGTATAQAFVGAFRAGLGGAVSGFLGGLGTGAINAAGDTSGATVNPQITANLRALEQLRAANDRLVESLNKIGPASTQNFGQGSAAAQQFGQNTTNIGTQINQVFGNAFSSLEGAITSFVTTGKLDFKSLINSILADLARMVVQMLIIKPLMGFFGGFFGGIFGFAQGGFVPGFAQGGIVGGFGGSTSDNVLARLSPGEFVVNAEATKNNRAALEMTNRTGQMPVQRSGGGSMVFAPTINVQSSGGEEGGQSAGRDIEVLMRKLWIEMAVKAKRKGGVLAD